MNIQAYLYGAVITCKVITPKEMYAMNIAYVATDYESDKFHRYIDIYESEEDDSFYAIFGF